MISSLLEYIRMWGIQNHPLRAGNRKKTLRIVISALGIYVMVTLLAAISTLNSANALSDSGVAVMLAGGSAEIDRLDSKIEKFEFRFRRIKRIIYPVRHAAKLLDFVAPIERQREGAELVLERVEASQLAARSALVLARSTFDIQDSVLSGEFSITDADSQARLKRSFEGLNSESSKLLLELEAARQFGLRFDELGVGGPISSVNGRLESQESRLAEIANFSGLLSSVMISDLELLGDMESIVDDLTTFTEGQGSIAELVSSLEEFELRLAEIGSESQLMVNSTPEAITRSQYGELVTTLHDLNLSSYGFVSGISSILGLVSEIFEELERSSGSVFGGGGSLGEVISRLIEEEDELAASASLVNTSIVSLLEIDDSGVVSLGGLGAELRSRAETVLTLSSMFEGSPRIAAEVFGIDGESRKYLMLGQTSAELRAAGGFTSSMWTLTFQDGAIVEHEYLDVLRYLDRDSLDRYPEAFDELRLHMDAGSMYIRDVGWDPNFPSVAELAADLYEIVDPVRVDGVISLTQWAFVDLSSSIGGVETEAGVLSSTGLLEEIERHTDAEGTGVLSVLLESLLDSLSGDVIRSNAFDLMATLKSLFESKDLMIYSADPAVQEKIVETGWDGSLPFVAQDRLAIVDSNVGWNKIDKSIDRGFDYNVDLSDLELPTAELTVSYVNNSTSEIKNCGVQAHVGNVGHNESFHDCYWNYFRVYIPVGAELLESSDLPLSAGAIASRVGGVTAGTQTVEQLFDENGDYVSGLMSLIPGDMIDVLLKYRLPDGVVRIDENVVDYSLEVVTQAGTRGRPGEVKIKVPPDSKILDVTPTPSSIDGDLLKFELDKARDERIYLKLETK